MDFQEAKRRNERALRSEGLSEKSIIAHSQALGHLERWCAARGINPMALTATERDEYLAEFARTHSKAYTRNHRIFIDRFFLRAFELGWVAAALVPGRKQRNVWVPSNQPDPDLILAAIGQFADHLLGRGCSERTAQNYCHLLLRFRAYLMQERLDWRQVELRQLMRFQSAYRTSHSGYRSRNTSQGGRSPTSVALMTTCVRSFYRWSARAGYVAFSPAVDLDVPKRNRPLPRSLSPSVLQKLLMLLNNPPGDLVQEQREEWLRNRMIILTLLYTCMRLSECAALTWEDIDFDLDRIKVLRKGNKEQYIPLSAALRQELLSYRRGSTSGPIFTARWGGRLTDEGISEMFRRFVQGQLSIPCTAHQLRHTAATWLINQGASAELIQLLLGHEDLRTTMRYARVNDRRVRSIVEQLPAAWCGRKESVVPPQDSGMSLESMRLLGGAAAD